MLIDWFTVAAQLINFVILAWLLKRFLYKPILNAIDAREERIAKELADAATTQSEAEGERDDYRRKNAEIDRQRDELLHQATDDANAERKRLVAEARTAAEALRADWQAGLERSQRSLGEEITRRTQEEVFAIARKALSDLAGASLEERMSEAFVLRLRALDDETLHALTGALPSASSPALVRSAFALPSEQHAKIRQAIDAVFATHVELRFETSPDFISGIEFTANSRRVAWTISEYLASMEKRVGELLRQSPDAKRAPGPASGDPNTAPASDPSRTPEPVGGE